jgi:DNA-binding MarR family transcriptional regulator
LAKIEDPENSNFRGGGDEPMPLAFDVVPLFQWWQDAVEMNMKAHELDLIPRSLGTLFVHIMYGERRPIRLAERLGVSRQAVHQMIRQLVERQMVEVEPDPDDGRATIIVPTADFNRSGNGILTILHAIETRMAKRFGERRFAIFKTMLREDWGVPPIVTQAEVEAAARERDALSKG